MAPLVVMLVVWMVVRASGFAGVWDQADSASGALRFAFAAMFVFTAISHFHPRSRRDLVRMVPAGLPAPGLLVTITGVLELIGAIGLMVPQAAAAAAYALSALLIAMFPANIRAARAGLMLAGRRATPLIWRLPLQLFWIAGLWWVARASPSLPQTRLLACPHSLLGSVTFFAAHVSGRVSDPAVARTRVASRRHVTTVGASAL